MSESGTSGSLGGEMMAQSNSLLCGYGHYKFMSTLILVLKATYILFISIRQRNNIYKNILGAASVTCGHLANNLLLYLLVNKLN